MTERIRNSGIAGYLSTALLALVGCTGGPPARDDDAALAEAKRRLPPDSEVSVVKSETDGSRLDGSSLRCYHVEARPPGAHFVVDMRISFYAQGGVTSSGFFSNADSRGGMNVNVVSSEDERRFVSWYNTTGRARIYLITARRGSDGVSVFKVSAAPGDPEPLRVTLDAATREWTPVP